MRKTTANLLLGLTVGVVLTPSGAVAVPTLPNFGAATFVPGAPIDNPYFPLTDHLTRIYEGQMEDEGEIVVERFELTNVGAGPTILGVQTTTRRDRAFVDGLLVEDTFDYYAQDTDGNVWYFGEDVTNYPYDDMGNPLPPNNASSWRAGVNGALPGFIMPVDLTVGFNYYQESAAADGALDQATTNATGLMVTIGIGSFTDVLRVLETAELDPDAREFKFYALGHGLVYVEEGLSPQLTDPEISLELVGIIPEPGTLTLLACGLSGFFAAGRRRKRT